METTAQVATKAAGSVDFAIRANTANRFDLTPDFLTATKKEVIVSSYNHVVLMGNITRDIELRYIPSGTAVADIGIAVNEKRKTAKGDWVEEVSFFDCVLWGRTAEVANEYLKKGSQVLIDGRLKQETWETPEGQKRSKVKVICEKMQMIGSKQDGNRSESASPEQSQADSPVYAGLANDTADASGDVPF